MEMVLNKKHWFMLENNLLNSVNGNVIQSQEQCEVSTNQGKKQVIQSIYNLMNLIDDSMVIIINNNITAQVINGTDIKKFRIYFRSRYDTNTSEIK